MEKFFSIREALQGTLQDYVRDSGFQCVKTEDLVRDLVSRLAAYREENVALFPEVFVLSTHNALASLSPSTPHHQIGVLRYGPDAADVLLKNAGTLAIAGWAIYIAKRDANSAEYGVFRSQRHSFSTSAEEAMQGLGADSPVLVLRNCGHLIVEVMNAKKDICNIALTSATASVSSLLQNAARLVEAASTKIPDDNTLFRPYLKARMTAILQKCHGTLIAVTDVRADDKPRRGLADGVWIVPHVDLVTLHTAATASGTADSLADLHASEALLSGMINSDGIVILGSDGTIRAFRVFLVPTASEKRDVSEKGGGRRRTFSLMQKRVRSGKLKAAFFRSQDGATDCERADP